MKKISMRFCQRNLDEEGSQEILDEQSKHNGDLVQIETYRCLGHCTICNQGPFCALNDLLFQEDNAASLNQRLSVIFENLQAGLKQRMDKS